jgi:hypothetical protein
MIAWAERAFLRLNVDVIQLHVVADGCHIFMALQLLQAEGVASQHRVARHEGMAEDRRRDSVVCEATTPFQAMDHLVGASWRRSSLLT